MEPRLLVIGKVPHCRGSLSLHHLCDTPALHTQYIFCVFMVIHKQTKYYEIQSIHELTQFQPNICHLCYSLLFVFPEIALQKLNEQKDIFTLGDWLVPALIGKMDVKSIWRKIQDHGWWQNDRNL